MGWQSQAACRPARRLVAQGQASGLLRLPGGPRHRHGGRDGRRHRRPAPPPQGARHRARGEADRHAGRRISGADQLSVLDL